MHVLIVMSGTAGTALRRRLWRAGYAVDLVVTGADGLAQADGTEYDAIVLDDDLPDMDGTTATVRLRGSSLSTPILLTAGRTSVGTRVRSLDAGADDYLTRPFAFVELTARLRAMTRRGRGPLQDDALVLGDLALQSSLRTAQRGLRVLELAPKEFALLEYFMEHAHQIVTRTMLLEHVWDYGFEPRTNAVDAAVKRLRRTLDAGKKPSLIVTVRGVGYVLRGPS